MAATEARHFRWSDIPEERVTDDISRRLITGDGMMLAHVYLKSGAVVTRTITSSSRTSCPARCASSLVRTAAAR
jgi:hypothetical protein